MHGDQIDKLENLVGNIADQSTEGILTNFCA